MGSSLVGLSDKGKGFGGLGLGLAPNTNIPFLVLMNLAEYDPIAPETWFTSWVATNDSSSGVPSVYYFIPGVNSAEFWHVAMASPTY